MNTIRSSAMAALGFALLTGNALPPTGTQTVQPIPLPPPELPAAASGFTTCTLRCDTLAMNCQNSCVPATGAAAANPLAPAGVTSSCNLSCATQQLGPRDLLPPRLWPE